MHSLRTVLFLDERGVEIILLLNLFQFFLIRDFIEIERVCIMYNTVGKKCSYISVEEVVLRSSAYHMEVIVLIH